jgi:hypothetical protein
MCIGLLLVWTTDICAEFLCWIHFNIMIMCCVHFKFMYLCVIKVMNSCLHEGESVNRSQMVIKHRTCDIRTWKKHLFLNISITTTDTLVPLLYQCVKTHSMLSQYSDGLRAGWWGFDSWQDKSFFLHLNVQTGCGVHPATYQVDTKSKAAGAWSWPLTSMQCRGQEWWSYTSIPPYIFMA